jgi:hypothetical protein
MIMVFFPTQHWRFCFPVGHAGTNEQQLIRQKKGKYTRLVGRHANYNIGSRAAVRWTEHMEAAVKEHSKLIDDQEAKEALIKYFRYTAHYIVAASDFMRPDQVRLGSILQLHHFGLVI